MADSYALFQRRMAALIRKHQALARGYTPFVGPDGLIELKPIPEHRAVPVRGILLTALFLVAFKSLMLASLGTATYQQRVDSLMQGSVVERAGGWIMQIDPATEQISEQIRPVVH